MRKTEEEHYTEQKQGECNKRPCKDRLPVLQVREWQGTEYHLTKGEHAARAVLGMPPYWNEESEESADDENEHYTEAQYPHAYHAGIVRP